MRVAACGAVLPRIVRAGRGFVVASGPVQRGPERSAQRRHRSCEQSVEPGITVGAGKGACSRNEQFAIAIDGSETDPVVRTELTEGDRGPCPRCQRTAAVVAEPVGEVLGFLRHGPRRSVRPWKTRDLDLGGGDRIPL